MGYLGRLVAEIITNQRVFHALSWYLVLGIDRFKWGLLVHNHLKNTQCNFGTMMFEELRSHVDWKLPTIRTMLDAIRVCYPGWFDQFYPIVDSQIVFQI